MTGIFYSIWEARVLTDEHFFQTLINVQCVSARWFQMLFEIDGQKLNRIKKEKIREKLKVKKIYIASIANSFGAENIFKQCRMHW